MMCRKLLLSIIIILIGVPLYSFNIATHIYVATQTYELWQSFDPEFYDSLLSESLIGKMTRQFYLIGVTLPDMFDPESQDGIDSLIGILYDHKNDLVGALHIKDVTYNNVHTRITFNGNYPNNNLMKLKEMVLYAKEHFDPLGRALIYGTYMHVVQDLYAHMVLEPSNFGYGYAVEADSSISYGLLWNAENYYEVFTATHIPSWDFVNDIYNWYEGFWSGGSYWFVENHYFPGHLQFLASYNRITGQYDYGWQDLSSENGWEMLQHFVEACQAVGYAGNSLTEERLRSYMHGWGIVLFMLFGHRGGRENSADKGGLLSHPDWNYSQIEDFWTDVLNRASGWYVPLPDFLKKLIIKHYMKKQLMPSIFGIGLPAVIDCLDNYSYSWPYFFEHASGIDQLWSCVPESLRTPDVLRRYVSLRQIVNTWDTYGTWRKPNLRLSYGDQINKILGFLGVMSRFLCKFWKCPIPIEFLSHCIHNPISTINVGENPH